MSKNNNSGQEELSKEQVKNSTETHTPAKKKLVFSLEKLRKDCNELFGVTQSTFDGCTNKLEGEFTIEEIQEKINKWLKTPIKIKKEEN